MANSQFRPVTETFSSSYELVTNAEIETYRKDEAIMDSDMLISLRERFGRPLIGQVGGLHYQFKPERAIPQGSLAVPQHNHDDPSALLIQNDGTRF